MKVSKIIVGVLQTNCYLLENGSECLLIDPGDESSKIKDFIKDKNLIGILITHKHFDHIGALDNFSKDLVLDKSNLEEKEYNIEGFCFEVIYTPGHKEDAITIYFKEENIMFTSAI